MSDRAAQLTIATLGGLDIRYGGAPLAGLASRKAEALLVYLACVPGPHPRELLADLLWDDLPAERGRGNLSVLLSSLRQLGGSIRADRQSVAFDHALPHWLDVAEIERAWAAARAQPGDAQALEALERALALYRGDFLQGFALRESAGFEAWARDEQERLRRLAGEARQALLDAAVRRGDHPAAIAQARQLLRLDPLREDVQRALMRALLAAGQRGAALEQYEICRRTLAGELGIAPEPATSALHREILAGPGGGAAGRQAGAAPRRQPIDNLPPQPTPFVGRTGELAQIVKRLGDPACRLLTLLGPGGAGKTRLALQAAALQRAVRPDGVAFVPLAGLDAPGQIVEAIGAALRISFLGQPDAPAHLLRALRERDLLLVLDNFEHLLEAAEFVAAMLERAPRLALIATSRERLGLRAEWLFDVAGLAYPQQPADQPAAATFSAVQLFAQQAARVQQQFALSPATTPAVVQICQRLEGLPLAIELAAAWARTLAVEEIASTVVGSLDALATDLRDVPARQRSMRAVFMHSWQLLGAAERTCLAELAVFRGGWTLAAARAVLAVGEGTAEQLLSALAERSLLRAGPRYSQHELLRQFAAEQLAADPARERAAQARHAGYFLQLVAEQGAALAGAHPQPALAAVSDNIENVRQAWQWALAERDLAALAGALDGLAAYDAAAGLAQAAADRFGAAAQALAADTRPEAVALRGRLLTMYGDSLIRCGAYDQAIEALAAAAQIAQAAGQPGAEAAARWRWGDALGCQGRYAEAHEQLDITMKIVADPSTLASALGALGTIEEEQGDYQAAAASYARTLALSQQLGDTAGEALALQRLGVVAEEQGRYAEAREHCQRALAIQRARGSRASEGGLLNNLGVVQRDESDYDAARAALAQAMAIGREVSNPRLIAIVSTNLGDVARDLGDYDAALEHYQRAMALRDELGNRHGVCQNTADLGLLLHLIGDDEAAREYSQQALDQARALEARSIEAFALTHLGHALLALEQPEDAAAAYAEALAIRMSLGQPSRALDAQAGLARARLTLGDVPAALGLAEAILEQLAAGPPHGAEEPARIALSCYQALAAAHDPRAAPLLRRASQELQRRADQIGEPAQRANFLEQVQAHRLLLYAAERP